MSYIRPSVKVTARQRYRDFKNEGFNGESSWNQYFVCEHWQTWNKYLHSTWLIMHFDGIWFCRHFRVCSHDCSRLRMTYNVAMSACERWREVFLLWEGMRWGDKVTSCICVVGDSLENNRLMGFQEVPWTIPHFGVSIYVFICIYTLTYNNTHCYMFLNIQMLVSHPLSNWTLSYPQHLLLHPFSAYQIHPKPPKNSFLLQAEGCGSKRHQLQCLAERGNFVAL